MIYGGEPITARELHVLALLAAGFDQAAVGASLMVGERMVRRVTRGLYGKLGAVNAANAVSLGYRFRLIDV